MRRLALHRQVDAVRGPHLGPRPRHDAARLVARPDVQGEEGVHMRVLQDPVRDHPRRPARGIELLRGLEDELHVPPQPIPQLGQDAGRAQKHRRVGVVPAGVHHAVHLGGVGQPRLLAHRQGVHIRPQGDGPPIASSAPQQPDDTMSADPGAHLQPQARQNLRHKGRRPLLLPAQLRLPMNPAAPLHDTAVVFVRKLPNLFVHPDSTSPSSKLKLSAN